MPISIPIIWRYLFHQYVKVLALCACAFIVILMTLRMNDIANFASFGASSLFVLQFTLNQMIFILPYALPISCFLSSILLVQRLSASHELTALRACGFSFRDIFFPLMLTAVLIAGINFILVSEVTTWATTSNIRLKEKIKSINPLVLAQNKHLMDLKGVRFISLAPSKMDKFVNHAILALPSKDHTKLHLMISKHIESNKELLTCEQMTLITNLGSETENEYDKLLVENIAKATTPSTAFATFLQDTPSTKPLKAERFRLLSLFKSLKKQPKVNRDNQRAYSEIIRRISSGLSPITFTFMGLAFGISISRRKSKVQLITAISLIATYLVVHLMAKEVKDSFSLSMAFYFLPHLLILTLSYWTIRRITKGIES